MTGWNTRLDGPIKWVMWVACLFTFLMMAHITVDVFLRVVFNAPMIGTFEVVANYYMVAVMYLPLAYVSRYEGQIIVELFTRKFDARTLSRWDAVAHLVTVVYVGLFTVYTAVMAIEQTETGEVKETGETFMEIWPARWFLPIAFGLMTVYLIVRARQEAGRARNFDPPVSA